MKKLAQKVPPLQRRNHKYSSMGLLFGCFGDKMTIYFFNLLPKDIGVSWCLQFGENVEVVCPKCPVPCLRQQSYEKKPYDWDRIFINCLSYWSNLPMIAKTSI